MSDHMDDETAAILAAKLKGDMEAMIRRVVLDALQDYSFWSDLLTTYPLQDAVFRQGPVADSFVRTVKSVILQQMQK